MNLGQVFAVFSSYCGKQRSDKFDLDSGAEVNLGHPAGMHSTLLEMMAFWTKVLVAPAFEKPSSK